MTDLRKSASRDDAEARGGVAQAIVAVFSDAIASGELAPGAKLPPTRQLAELAGVNHLTAARAYRRLAERGLVVSRVGSGTFVRALPLGAERRAAPGSATHFRTRSRRTPTRSSRRCSRAPAATTSSRSWWVTPPTGCCRRPS